MAGMNLFKGDKRSAAMNGFKAIQLFMQDPTDPAKSQAAHQKQVQIRSSVADVIQFSGCRDEQTSADGTCLLVIVIWLVLLRHCFWF